MTQLTNDNIRKAVREQYGKVAKTILVIGGAGGVGSITIQLLRALTDVF